VSDKLYSPTIAKEIRTKLSAAIDAFGDREFITSSYGNHEDLLDALMAVLSEHFNEIDADEAAFNATKKLGW
jgi:hypothetical protein